MEQLNDLERIMESNPLKALSIILRLEDIHLDLEALKGRPEAAAYWNIQKQELMTAYPILIPGERVLINLYGLVNDVPVSFDYRRKD